MCAFLNQRLIDEDGVSMKMYCFCVLVTFDGGFCRGWISLQSIAVAC